MWIRQILVAVVGLASGFAVAAGLFSFIIGLGAMGAKAVRATTREEFADAFKFALNAGGPVVIDCQIDSDDKVWPMVAPGAPINECFDGKDFESKNK